MHNSAIWLETFGTFLHFFILSILDKILIWFDCFIFRVVPPLVPPLLPAMSRCLLLRVGSPTSPSSGATQTRPVRTPGNDTGCSLLETVLLTFQGVFFSLKWMFVTLQRVFSTFFLIFHFSHKYFLGGFRTPGTTESWAMIFYREMKAGHETPRWKTNWLDKCAKFLRIIGHILATRLEKCFKEDFQFRPKVQESQFDGTVLDNDFDLYQRIEISKYWVTDLLTGNWNILYLISLFTTIIDRKFWCLRFLLEAFFTVTLTEEITGTGCCWRIPSSISPHGRITRRLGRQVSFLGQQDWPGVADDNCCIQRRESRQASTESPSWPRTTTVSQLPLLSLTMLVATPSAPSPPPTRRVSRWSSRLTPTITWWPTSPGCAISPLPREDTTSQSPSRIGSQRTGFPGKTRDPCFFIPIFSFQIY